MNNMISLQDINEIAIEMLAELDPFGYEEIDDDKAGNLARDDMMYVAGALDLVSAIRNELKRRSKEEG